MSADELSLLRQVIREAVENSIEILEEKKKSKALSKACWSGYEAYGFKNKNGKRVPNCVPKGKKRKKKS